MFCSIDKAEAHVQRHSHHVRFNKYRQNARPVHKCARVSLCVCGVLSARAQAATKIGDFSRKCQRTSRRIYISRKQHLYEAFISCERSDATSSCKLREYSLGVLFDVLMKLVCAYVTTSGAKEVYYLWFACLAPQVSSLPGPQATH